MCQVDLIEYCGLKNCIRVSNGEIELIAITEIGPRIIRYGFVGGENELLELSDQINMPTEDEWQIFGGHRLWHSPEFDGRTNIPDYQKSDFELIEDGFVISQPTEKNAFMKKTMTFTMNPDGSINALHTIQNEGLWPVDLALWALTVMAPGGTAVFKNPCRDTGFLSNRTLSLWPYTKMNDSRVTWGDKYICLRQDPSAESNFKFGFPNEAGFAAYFNHGNMFIKKHVHLPSELYPDSNCSFETYTNPLILEMETLSPLITLQPGESEDHFERWELYKGIQFTNDETELDNVFLGVEL